MQQKIYLSLFLFFFISGLFAQSGRSQEEAIFADFEEEVEQEEGYQFHKKPNIAVLPFVDANAMAKETEFGRTVSAMLVTALRSRTNFSVVERSELQKIISEQVLDLSGLTKQRSEKIRELLQVDVILVGDVSLIDNTLHIDARLFDISSSKVVAALYGSCQDLKKIRVEVEKLAQELEQTYLRQWMGSISITSALPDAEVYLDEKFIGKTVKEKPLLISDLLEGRYNLKLIRGGFYDWEGDISVLAKMDRSVRVSLTAKPGSMNIHSEPPGAKIYIDNTYVGETPMSIKTVAEGEHEIRLMKINYKLWTRKVIVRSFQPTDVKTTLEVSPGMLSVTSEPSGADIYLKGKFVARTPHTLSNIVPGEVVLRIEKNGYEEWTTSAFIQPNGQEVVDVVLKEMIGKLTIVTNPEGAAVYLTKSNQKEMMIGTTPILNYVTTIGNYAVRVDKNNFYDVRKTVNVKTDQITDVNFTLDEKPGSILVNTEPVNARIFLDGIYKGRAPLNLDGLKKGDYLVTMAMPYDSKTVKVTVKPNKQSVAKANLSKPLNYVFAMSVAGLSAFLFQYLAQ